MFSKARRGSRAAKQKPAIPQDALPISPLQDTFSIRSESPALLSPRRPFAENSRPASADDARPNRTSSFGPPVLPAIPRVASIQNLKDDGDFSSLKLDFSSPSFMRSDTDNASISSRKSALRPQTSYEHFSRPRSTASQASNSPRNLEPPMRQESPSTSSQRSSRARLPLRDQGPSSPIVTSYITQDPMFPRSTSLSPQIPKFAQSDSSIRSRDSVDTRSGRRVTSNGDEPRERRKSRRVGRAVTGPTMVIDTTIPPRQKAEAVTNLSSDVDSPRMEASMFPTYEPKPTDQSPVMDRDFIDSRDRPYSQAKPRTSLSSPSSPVNFARPNIQATQINLVPTTSTPIQRQPTSALGKAAKSASEATSTIGVSFESTSAAFPAPQMVATRPKTEGATSTIAGVQVPTHHTSTARQDVSKAEKRRTKLLNPMTLLGRKKSTAETTVLDEEDRKALLLAEARQKMVASVGIDKLPEDYDPRIRGKIVHDFSAPRASRRDFSSPGSLRLTEPLTSPIQEMPAEALRRSTHTPVFVEHLDSDSVDRQRNIATEDRENKDFLARFSQQSSTSQESAVLPPFARRSQNLESQQSSGWKDDDASWSSGRDSGGVSSTGQVGDRESGISTFSAVSPITRSSDGTAWHGFGSSLSPTSPYFDRKFERPTSREDRPTSAVSNLDPARPRTQSDSTARPTSVLPTMPALEPIPGGATPDEHSPSNVHAADFPIAAILPHRDRERSPASSPATKDGTVAKSKSNASRFSFQMGADDGKEKELEGRFKDSGVFSKPIDDEDDDYFDEDAMDDLDEMELAQQQEEVAPQQERKPTFTNPQYQPKLTIPDPGTTSTSASTRTPGQPNSDDDFFYTEDAPYVPNERELTYAEHPIFQAHHAFADSRRESFQSALLDSYLAESPTSPHRRDERSRQSSLTSESTNRESRQSSTARASSTQRIATMSPLPEQSETTTSSEQTPMSENPVTPVLGAVPVDSALGSFKLADLPDQAVADSPLKRADSDSEVKPRWERTSRLWKQYRKEDEPDDEIPAIPKHNSFSQPRVVSPRSPTTESPNLRGAYYKGVRVRKPTGSTRQSRLSMMPSKLESISQSNEDMYYDDGEFDKEAPVVSKTDENSIDRLPVPDRATKDYSKPQRINTGTSETTIQGQPLPTSPRTLQAYHQALADAANRAAESGRFTRKASLATGNAELQPQPASLMINTTGSGTAAVTPGKMAFDFGFDAPAEENDDWIHEDVEDDDIVAAANADVLAQDIDGFYGSEFGFYANARPGAEVEATNGGFFGEDGDDGLTRKRSVKEPDLTPITERSEFSTRNSFVNLGGLTGSNVALSSSALSTPALARMSVTAFGDNDITTFEQLKQLRKNAFGGSNGSLGSRGSPTSQHFPGSVAMAVAYSTGSSSSGDRLATNDSPLEHLSQRVSLIDPASQTHSRTGSGTETVTYVREHENGAPRWIIEKRRTSSLGHVEVAREVADGWI